MDQITTLYDVNNEPMVIHVPEIQKIEVSTTYTQTSQVVPEPPVPEPEPPVPELEPEPKPEPDVQVPEKVAEPIQRVEIIERVIEKPVTDPGIQKRFLQ